MGGSFFIWLGLLFFVMQQKLNVILGYKMGWMLYEMIIQYWGGEGNGKGGKGTPVRRVLSVTGASSGAGF